MRILKKQKSRLSLQFLLVHQLSRKPRPLRMNPLLGSLANHLIVALRRHVCQLPGFILEEFALVSNKYMYNMECVRRSYCSDPYIAPKRHPKLLHPT